MAKLPEVFRPGMLASLRPASIHQHVQQQHSQASQASEPQLLQRLYVCLDEKAFEEALKPHVELQSTARQQALQGLNAYHRVYDLLLASLTTYRPCLLQIKQAYDDALRDAAAAACDNAYLHGKLSMVPQQQAEAIAASRQTAVQSAAAMEGELQAKLADLEQQIQQVEAECQDVEQQLQQQHKHMAQARRELDQLQAFSKRTHRELLDSSSWHMLSSAVAMRDSQPGTSAG